MTLPNQPSIELPLLLELERAGGGIRRGPEIYERVAAHLRDITPADRQMLRSDGRTKVFEHNVDWARDHLHRKRQVNGGQRGLWQITQDGKKRLRQELGSLGIPATDVESFIRGRDSLPQVLGPRWKPTPWTERPRGPQGGPKPKRPQPPPGPGVVPPPGPEPQPVDIHAQLLERVRSLDDKQFERLCGRLMEALGFEHVEITGRSHDRGIDGHVTLKHLRLTIAFQAKNWRNNPVGGPRVREFRGSIVNRFPLGVCVTTSSFTTGAEEEANEPGPPKMVLVDGDKLVEIMLERGLGVHTVPVTKQEISEDFFASI